MLSESDHLSHPITDADHAYGLVGAPVTIVEYGEYECPFCKAAQPLVDELVRALGDNLRFVFRHFPVMRIHVHAEHAAEAAEAAGAQGKFWEMHKLLFANQNALDDESLLRYARRLGLDGNRFESDLAEHTYRSKVRADILSALQSGARGTRTFFIDGVRYDSPPDLREMLALIREKHPGLHVPDASADIRVPGMTAYAHATGA